MSFKAREWFTVMSLTSLALAGCGVKNKSTNSLSLEDSSASGTAASVVGGALSASSSSGTQARFVSQPHTLLASVSDMVGFIPEAVASSACATFRTTGLGCSVSSGTMWLSYNDCSFGSSAVTWNGTQALIMSAGSASCGTFPNPGSSASLIRQFVTAASSTTPGSATVTSEFGTSITIDDATANLGNFNGDTLSTAPYTNSGYGVKVAFNGGGARSSLSISEHTTGKIGGVTVFDHSITTGGTPLTITETAGNSSRSVSGSLTVYHNLVRVIGTSTFNSVTHTDRCCFPTSGSITTTFAAGSVPPTAAGSRLVGKRETLKFTGCGTATLTDTSGDSFDVTLSRCI